MTKPGVGECLDAVVTEIRSVPFRSRFRNVFWLSSARLDSSFDESYANRFAVPLYGLGWGKSRKESESASLQDGVLLAAHRLLAVAQEFEGRTLIKEDASLVGFALHNSDQVDANVLKTAFYHALGYWCLDQLD